MQADNLRELDRLIRALPDVRTKTLSLVDVLSREVTALVDGHRARVPAMAELLRLHAPWPREDRRRDDDQLLARPLSLADARAAIASMHRFASWDAVLAAGDRPVDPAFEAAADAVVAGDAPALRSLVARDPSLPQARSPFHHRSTLLHYVAANGVEETRQWQTPPNAVEIARILLDGGADPDAICPCYGEDDTPMGLLVTSAHPSAAGVQAALVELLCAAGANPNGRDEDGAPLWAACTFGYTAAVDALVRCGARLDNLVLAAAAGDLAGVRAHFDVDGRLKPIPTWGRARIPGGKLDIGHVLEYALIQAALHGRRAVVELLLAKNPDLTVHEPNWNNTALSAARWSRNADIVALLEPRMPH
jgi:hypothetical protein